MSGPGTYSAIVLGAGISGLVSASVLLRQGADSVAIVDEFPEVGGNHRSFDIGGYTFDIGSLIFQDDSPLLAHFPELLSLYVPIQPTWTRVNPQGRVTTYPFSVRDDLLDAGPRECSMIVASIAKNRVLMRGRQHTAADFAHYWLGDRLAHRSGLDHYIERFCGMPGDQIDLDFARSRMMWIAEYGRAGKALRHVIAARNGQQQPRTNTQLVRCREGFPALYQPAVDRLRSAGAEVHLGTATKSIERTDDGFVVHTAAGALRAPRVISTIPIPAALELIGEQPVRLPSVTLTSLFYSFEGTKGFDSSVLYNFSYGGAWKRLTVHSDFYGTVDGREYFSVEVPGEEPLAATDCDADFRSHVASMGLFSGSLKLEGDAIHENAYPIYTLGSAARAADARSLLGSHGIESLGKQGAFAYQPTARVSTHHAERALGAAPSPESRLAPTDNSLQAPGDQ
ncbi:FAD-dependent oxidoreductase [Branchiibius sp. NY16-3462-2]|uniref:FAD-dependent oxidoreductase n=1 Tax=Branchiibius sp. NY16-3462-2 TaxID=1807500 RepID=UPI000794F541|nr:FAD-dependent oxidoreductase [Branchiibius sp. NY16-3462-2]KYH44976.1 hypothetical protein AZH51_13845 [Branchiibius sp. NY16-3462-2]